MSRADDCYLLNKCPQLSFPPMLNPIINLNKQSLMNEINKAYFLNYKYNSFVNNNLIKKASPKKEYDSPKKEDNAQDTTQNIQELKKFKTEICHSWEISHTCKYGNNCSFAHGHDELRKALENNKLIYGKKKLCRQFFYEGYCKYGKRCQFCHKIDNIKYSNLLKDIEKNKKVAKIKKERLLCFRELMPSDKKEKNNT